MTYDVEKIRSDFPILSEKVHGKRLAFLDTGASAQKPSVVTDTIASLYNKTYANIHRGVYKFSQHSTDAYEAVREKVRGLLNAKFSHECIFVRGATEGINLVAQSYGRAFLNEGDEVILTTLEHHSNIVPWQMLRDEKNIVIKVVPITDDGQVDMDAYKKLLSPRTKFVSIIHVSNAIGTIVPVKEMTALAHEVGAKVLIDGCQAVPHMAVDVQDLDADFYVFSGHKIYGPTGIGVVYGKEELLNAMPPWQGGGDMIASVTFEETIYNELPHKFEAGTPDIAGGIGLGAAIDYVLDIGFDEIEAYEEELLAYATKELTSINSLRIIGTAKEKAGIISFVLEGIHPHDLGTILDQEGVAIRTGHHCTQPIMDRYEVHGTSRASLGIYNTKQDIDQLVAGIRKAQSIFG
ncbi:MAG: cysteine desulfurase [Sphingomonadales bacterium]|nr:cysteine desulfurase [Sphingomonadales bacterium]